MVIYSGGIVSSHIEDCWLKAWSINGLAEAALLRVAQGSLSIRFE